MSKFTYAKAKYRLENAEKHLSRITLPIGVNLNEYDPFKIQLVNCAKCGCGVDKWKSYSGWMIQCDSVECDVELSAPVNEEWKASLLWNQLNAKNINYELMPFFNLHGLNKNKARYKIKHIDNFIRMNRDKSLALDFFNSIDKTKGYTMYWDILYYWVLCAKSSINQFKKVY